MKHLGQLLILAGILVFVYGVHEWRASSNAQVQPAKVSIADVEQGHTPDNTHWKIGEHIAMLSDAVLTYRKSKVNPAQELKASSDIEYVYYPIGTFVNDSPDDGAPPRK